MRSSGYFASPESTVCQPQEQQVEALEQQFQVGEVSAKQLEGGSRAHRLRGRQLCFFLNALLHGARAVEVPSIYRIHIQIIQCQELTDNAVAHQAILCIEVHGRMQQTACDFFFRDRRGVVDSSKEHLE